MNNSREYRLIEAMRAYYKAAAEYGTLVGRYISAKENGYPQKIVIDYLAEIERQRKALNTMHIDVCILDGKANNAAGLKSVSSNRQGGKNEGYNT